MTIAIAGLAELNRKFAALPPAVERNVVRSSMLEGARPMRDDARNRAPEYHGDVQQGHPPPGTLKKAIIIKYIPELSRGGRFVYFILVRHGKKFQKMGKKQVNRDAYYWWFVERGHYTRAAGGQLKRGRGRLADINAKTQAGSISFVPPVSFMRKAFESQRMPSLDKILDAMRRGVLLQARAL